MAKPDVESNTHKSDEWKALQRIRHEKVKPMSLLEGVSRRLALGFLGGLIMGSSVGAVEVFSDFAKIRRESPDMRRAGMVAVRRVLRKGFTCMGFFGVYYIGLGVMENFRFFHPTSKSYEAALISGGVALLPFVASTRLLPAAQRGSTIPLFMLLVGMDLYERYRANSKDEETRARPNRGNEASLPGAWERAVAASGNSGSAGSAGNYQQGGSGASGTVGEAPAARRIFGSGVQGQSGDGEGGHGRS